MSNGLSAAALSKCRLNSQARRELRRKLERTRAAIAERDGMKGYTFADGPRAVRLEKTSPRSRAEEVVRRERVS